MIEKCNTHIYIDISFAHTKMRKRIIYVCIYVCAHV